MTSLLNSAIIAHSKGDLDAALNLYAQSITNKPTSVAIQNAIAALRELGRTSKAHDLIQIARANNILTPGILKNYSNVCSDESKFYLSILAIREAILLFHLAPDEYDEFICMLCNFLRQADLPNLCISVGVSNLPYISSQKRYIELLVGTCEYIISHELYSDVLESLASDILDYLNSTDSSSIEPLWRARSLMSLGIAVCRSLNRQSGLQYFFEGWDLAHQIYPSLEHTQQEALLSLLDVNGWNISIHLLKLSEFDTGWKLYDHGLNVKASGPQRWQRALLKPFTNDDIPIWPGPSNSEEIIPGILVIGEQGIGDTMMFAQLLPKLYPFFSNIYFLPGNRLDSIYNRLKGNVHVVASEDVLSLRTNFSYQIPIGSLPKYFIRNSHSDSSAFDGLLVPDPSTFNNFSARYKSLFPAKKLVGISWQGGGRKGRIEKKSIKLDIFLRHFQHPEIQLVSLQYGDDSQHVERANVDHPHKLYDDPSVDAAKDMDLWLSQVACMDAVVSIANTTIHGSGG